MDFQFSSKLAYLLICTAVTTTGCNARSTEQDIPETIDIQSSRADERIEVAVCSTNNIDPHQDGFSLDNGENCSTDSTTNIDKPPVAEEPAQATDVNVAQLPNEVEIILPTNSALDCVSASSDPDGDGYGFENGRTCLVNASLANTSQLETIQPVADKITCISATSDPDGDGYGFENGISCLTPVSLQTTIQPEQLTPLRPQLANALTSFANEVPDNLHLVTDVILTAGQSNAFANGTRFEPAVHVQDRLDDRILVWTQHNGWKKANPHTQIWEHDKYPAQPWDPAVASNSPGIQMARAIVDSDPSRVVAFIPTSSPGQPIAHWRYGDKTYNAIKQRVENALNDIPHKYQVDLIWWMQGEADAEANDYYRGALKNLITNWRGEPWYSERSYFIANETIRFPVNQIFRELRKDKDPYTDFSPAEGLPSINGADDVHFNSQSYRIIGNRVRDVYLRMQRKTAQIKNTEG